MGRSASQCVPVRLVPSRTRRGQDQAGPWDAVRPNASPSAWSRLVPSRTRRDQDQAGPWDAVRPSALTRRDQADGTRVKHWVQHSPTRPVRAAQDLTRHRRKVNITAGIMLLPKINLDPAESYQLLLGP